LLRTAQQVVARRWRELGRVKNKGPKDRPSEKPVDPEKGDSKDDVPIDRLTILLRAFVERKKKKRRKRPPKEMMPSDWTLIFDTETTTGDTQDQVTPVGASPNSDRASQRLRFGAYQLRRRGMLEERGVFYDPEALTEADVSVIHEVIDAERAEAPGERICLMTRTEFVENVLFHKAYGLGALIVGFNLPFDLSRLAIDHVSARRRMKGGFSFKLSERIDRHLRIKHLSRKAAMIDFAATTSEMLQENEDDQSRITDRGYFVDVNTLAVALTSKSRTLKKLSETLKVRTPKLDSDEHGRKLTPEYVRYGIRDVQATWECFDVLAKRYASYRLDSVGLHELYSEASLGKAYLRTMNVRPWRRVQPDAPSKMIGHIMSAYFGGRSEIHLRRQITQVFYCDFRSMYPTVCTLMGLWRFVIAQGINWKDDTTAVKKLLETWMPSDLQNPEIWKQLPVLVKVLPDNDVFPIRAKYPIGDTCGEGDVATIGLNRLTRTEPLWFTLADCLVSKILTGKIPNIVEAIRFDPRPIQDDLKPILIAGNKEYRIDPTVDDFYKRLIELRQEVKIKIKQGTTETLKSDDLALKILANSTSYGIFERTDPFRSAVPIDPDQLFRLIPISRSD
jgi:hypothetical protein